MPPIFARTLTALGLIATLGGCPDDGDRAEPVGDSAARNAASRQPAPARAPLSSSPADSAGIASGRADTARPGASTSGGLGRWDVAALEKRLDLQGMAPRKQSEPVRHPFLSVAGTSYLIGNAELQVFIYEDAAAAERDLAKLDTTRVAPRGERVKWPTKPTLIRNNNLAAILLGQNALQIERVQRALMAGLPPAP